MSKLEMKNLNGEKVKDIKLNDNVFGIETNDVVLHDAIVLAMASVRQGSIRATQWRKGGIVFGPKPRDYSKKQNRKERRLALKSALTYLAKDNAIIVLDSVKFETNKTKEMVNLLNKLDITYNKVLFVVEELDDNTCLASRNLANVKLVLPSEVNTYDVVNCDNMVITSEALKSLEEALTNE